jgi:hypothetical protein
MSQHTKFKVVQSPDTHKIRLEVWRRYGDKPDEWFTDESLTDLSVQDLKELGLYITTLIEKSKKHT